MGWLREGATHELKKKYDSATCESQDTHEDYRGQDLWHSRCR